LSLALPGDAKISAKARETNVSAFMAGAAPVKTPQKSRRESWPALARAPAGAAATRPASEWSRQYPDRPAPTRRSAAAAGRQKPCSRPRSARLEPAAPKELPDPCARASPELATHQAASGSIPFRRNPRLITQARHLCELRRPILRL